MAGCETSASSSASQYDIKSEMTLDDGKKTEKKRKQSARTSRSDRVVIILQEMKSDMLKDQQKLI